MLIPFEKLGLAALVVIGGVGLLPALSAQSTTAWTFCAKEKGVCAFTGTKEVRYGANGFYVTRVLTNGTACTNQVFGDPIIGTVKQCDTRDLSWTSCALEGGFCAFAGTTEVRYGANGSYYYRTLTDGTPCTNAVFGDPAYRVRKQCEIMPASSPAVTAASSIGPQVGITCPANAVNIWPGTDIQGVVDLHPGATTFCLRAGMHALTRSITPKTGNTFVGEHGAILDGTSWMTTDDPNHAAFRSHNQDIDDVTIRNLVIRNMPKRGVYAHSAKSDRWTVEYNEIAHTLIGVGAPNRSVVRNNHLHHNSAGGYAAHRSTDTVFENNDISYNGSQKVVGATNITFRNNFVHHNGSDGIWYDADCTGGLIEGNVVEDHPREGIFYEISSRGVIRNNTVRRNGYSGIYISTSKDVEIYNNTLEDNFRGIQYFLNCSAVGGGSIGYDLANNTARDNVVKVGTRSGSLASGLSYVSSCTSTQVSSYINGSKNLQFINNGYFVPSLTPRYLFWGFATLVSWNQWQTIGNDLTGRYQ
jgi:parallel beta-helix repeat protein